MIVLEISLASHSSLCMKQTNPDVGCRGNNLDTIWKLKTIFTQARPVKLLVFRLFFLQKCGKECCSRPGPAMEQKRFLLPSKLEKWKQFCGLTLQPSISNSHWLYIDFRVNSALQEHVLETKGECKGEVLKTCSRKGVGQSNVTKSNTVSWNGTQCWNRGVERMYSTNNGSFRLSFDNSERIHSTIPAKHWPCPYLYPGSLSKKSMTAGTTCVWILSLCVTTQYALLNTRPCSVR